MEKICNIQHFEADFPNSHPPNPDFGIIMKTFTHVKFVTIVLVILSTCIIKVKHQYFRANQILSVKFFVSFLSKLLDLLKIVTCENFY